MAGHGYASDHFWEGSVLSPADFESPAADAPKRFDAAICIGVMSHVPIRPPESAGAIAPADDDPATS